jgi:hypothetical protein
MTNALDESKSCGKIHRLLLSDQGIFCKVIFTTGFGSQPPAGNSTRGYFTVSAVISPRRARTEKAEKKGVKN